MNLIGGENAMSGVRICHMIKSLEYCLREESELYPSYLFLLLF